MKTKSGRNQKWIVRPEHRGQVRALFLKGFEAGLKTPSPELDLFELADGTNVGVFFEAEALDEVQARKGAWLEFLVEDPAASAEHLAALAIARVDFSDKSHAYFQAPGGPVFRLAQAGSV